MTAEQVATEIIKDWEKCELVAYKPLPTDPWTIGWGATGPNITQGTTWTQQQADTDLLHRVTLLSQEVRQAVTAPATDNELGAMIDLAYNIGIGVPAGQYGGPTGFRGSTLLRLFNEGNTPGAGQQFLVWDESAGHVVQGLENRREAEQRVFFT